jgi:drug/metabolite transporter (DMT)-like permease
MPPLAVALALTAAFFHATWNLLLARARDKNAAIGVAMVFGPIVVLPIALLDWHFEAGAIPYALFSALLELAYFAMLAWSYQRAELSLIYPIARGLAPVFVLILGAVLLGSAPSQVQALGILIVGMGVILVRGLRAPASLVDVLAAVGIAVLIASYTLVDQQGLQYADPISYLVVVVLLPGAVYAGGVAARGGLPRLRSAATPSVLVGGLAVVAAYGLVLAALTLTHAASVAAVREVSIVIATALAALVLHEHVSRSRWLGAIVVVAGIALVVAG